MAVCVAHVKWSSPILQPDQAGCDCDSDRRIKWTIECFRMMSTRNVRVYKRKRSNCCAGFCK